jgi:outer membrane protein TolC
MIPKEYQGIRYDDPKLQAEFERLLAQVSAAERARAPFAQQLQQAEQQREDGAISRGQFEAAEDKYISANNDIARAKRAVDQFLGQYKFYRVEK